MSSTREDSYPREITKFNLLICSNSHLPYLGFVWLLVSCLLSFTYYQLNVNKQINEVPEIYSDFSVYP